MTASTDQPFPPIPHPEDFEMRIRLAEAGTRRLPRPKRVAGAGEIREEGGVPVQTMFNGVKVLADSYYGPWVTRMIEATGGYHEPQEEVVFEALMAALATPNPLSAPTMIELGCYWAYYSSWFLRDNPSGRAVCIDSYPPAVFAGRTTATLNGVSRRATFEHGAVGKVSLEQLGADGQPERVMVPPVTVPAVMARHGIDQLTILHADIQGFEDRMLAEAQPVLSTGRVDYVVLSTHSQELHAASLAVLEGHGYRVFAAHDLLESYAFDGLIAAARPGLDFPETVPIPKRGPKG